MSEERNGSLPGADLEFQRYHVTLEDGGAYYAETNLNNFIVEPWNALSSLFLLLPAIFWAYKIRRNIKDNGFLAYCIPLMFLGGLGSTLFHAFRSSPFLLMLDVLPILIVTASVAAFFWKNLLRNWPVALTIAISSLCLRIFISKSNIFPVHTATNLSYALSGLTIFLPAILIVFKTRFYKAHSLILSFILFSLALFFREMDAWNIPALSMGTHFLWHVSTAIGAYFLGKYLFNFKNVVEINLPALAEDSPSLTDTIPGNERVAI